MLIQARKDQRAKQARGLVQSGHIKTAGFLLKDALYLIDSFGESQCGLLTITCLPGMTAPKARERFSRLTALLKPHFPAQISVVAPGNDGHPHIHVLVGTDHNIREGFNAEAYWAMRRISDQQDPSLEDRILRCHLGRNVTTNPHLKALWSALRVILPQAGFARRFDLTPILKGPEAVSKYLLDNYYDAVRAIRTHQVLGKKIRFRIASRSQFSWPRRPAPNPNSLGRRQLRVIANALGVPYSEMKLHFGPKWAFDLRGALDELEGYHSLNPEHWPRESVVQSAIRYLRLRPDSRFRKIQLDQFEHEAALWAASRREQSGDIAVHGYVEAPGMPGDSQALRSAERAHARRSRPAVNHPLDVLARVVEGNQ